MKHIIANFKSNKNTAEIKEWVSVFLHAIQHQALSTSIVLCPPLPHLSFFESVSRTKNIALGVQDMSPFPAGSYTGAVGTKNLEEYKIQFAIVGHSERRRYFHETNQDIANKVHECIQAGITPIVCVTKEEINAQANALTDDERKKVMVAFEPIEHIGTGTSDSLTNILETKKWIQTAFGDVPYIYGGSVNPSTDSTILQSEDIDGFLVGSACLDPEVFYTLLSKIQ
ncbi:MAG: triose-phosphate isomerase family protein [Candidatus Woesebacteria bacterium]